LSPNIEEHDFQVKLRNAERFIGNNDKVKVTMRFRGREITHSDLGRDVLVRFRNELGDTAVVEQEPKMEGRQMTMMLGPAPDQS
jgi:translation initiation factor IF-3